MLFVTLLFYFRLIKQALVSASEGELCWVTISPISQFCAPFSLIVFPSPYMQCLTTEGNEGGGRGESGTAFSMRVELADTQLLPHPNYHLCEVALGAELDAGFLSENI